MTRDRRRTLNLHRHASIPSAAALGSGLILGFRLPLASARSTDPGVSIPHGFIQIAPDETIRLLLPSVEMGQGTNTSLSMIIMEELEGDWNKIDVHHAPVADICNNSRFTSGSGCLRGWGDELRKVGAAAREMLVRAAAGAWGVSPGECRVSRGVISHRPSGRRLSFGQVAGRAADLPVPQDPPLRPATRFQPIGKPLDRTDTPLKVVRRANG